MRTLQSKTTLSSLAAMAAIVILSACDPGDELGPSGPAEHNLGQIGNLHFNLQAANAAHVNLDLYVQDPLGNIFSSATGELNVDCLCGECHHGRPHENIFWPFDSSTPKGPFRYWVNYVESCDGSNASSSFTIRVLKNGSIVDTHTGNLTLGNSTVWYYVYD